MSLFEKAVDSIGNKFLIYVGSSRHGQKRLFIDIGNGRSKCPDFVIINNEYFESQKIDQINKNDLQTKIANDFYNGKLKIKKVVECFGAFWHKPKNIFVKDFIKKTELIENEENKLKNIYNKINIECLIIWDFLFYNDQQSSLQKINNFVTKED
jgi:hypothetical protein